jgi:23S rRNA (uracil1939-C5)-methyltransferase
VCPRYTYGLILSIEKLIYGGDGLARAPVAADGRSMAVFVPFVLPGERVEADVRQEKSGFGRGAVKQLIEPSPDRIEARCPYFRQCGGCHYQHIRYQRQLELKAEILRETLRRIAKIELQSEIQLHGSSPWNYRNRTRLQVRTAPEFTLGYFRFGSHDFLPIQECPISSPLINRTIARVLALGGLNCPVGVREIELFADAGDERLLAWAFCEQEASKKDLMRWAEALRSEALEIAGVAFFPSRFAARRRDSEGRAFEHDSPFDQKPLLQSGAMTLRYRTREHEYQVSAGSFFQGNRHLIDELISVVTGNARGDVALDLYGGVGLFSAALAQSFHHIFAVEASLTAQGDLVQNVPANVKAVGARAEDYLRDHQRRSDSPGSPVWRRPDLVVLDPPRSGVGKEGIRSLAELSAPHIRYVSCDPATLARDLTPLVAAGYRIEEAHLFDLFPQTFHIESVMLLAR